MLVVTRRIGESVRIGEAIVTVLGIQGSRAKLGIEAPSAIRILRTELEESEAVPMPPVRALRLVGAA